MRQWAPLTERMSSQVETGARLCSRKGSGCHTGEDKTGEEIRYSYGALHGFACQNDL